MDYHSQPLLFKVKKAVRYLSLYGAARTMVKIKGQYHMKRRFSQLPERRDSVGVGKHVGLLGAGNYAFSNIAYYLRKNYGAVMRGVMDVDLHHAASLFKTFDLEYYTSSAEEVLDDPAIDLVYVASNHSTHAEYAIGALQRGKHVHIEKPHAVSLEQLVRLCQAMRDSPAQVVSVGFNRPRSRLGLEVHSALGSQSGASVLNWFVAGHQIDPEHWYFRPEEGGRVLGNLCHWTDFTLGLVPRESRYPIVIQPTRSSRSDCDIAVTYLFADGTVAAITFSAKGHTFEGVRERFSAHRGDVLIDLDDFQRLVVENVERKRVYRERHRDQGHEESIKNSYESAKGKGEFGACALEYVWETGELFLRTKEALDSNQQVVVDGYSDAKLT